jgi:phosphinothricin acetyltransferase
MSGPEIRPANDADLGAVQAIYNEAIEARMSTADLAPQPVELRRRWFADRDHSTRPVVVATDPACGVGEVVGWGAFTNFKDRVAYAPTAEISVYVARRAHGRGVGRRILDELLSRTEACGIDRVLAICFEHNEASLRLFRSRGFVPWGTLPGVCDMDGVRRGVVILGWSRPS